LVDLFGDVALVDPLSAILLLAGALLTGAAVTVLGYLSDGALVSLVVPQ
jgi:hypothetical protein